MDICKECKHKTGHYFNCSKIMDKPNTKECRCHCHDGCDSSKPCEYSSTIRQCEHCSFKPTLPTQEECKKTYKDDLACTCDTKAIPLEDCPVCRHKTQDEEWEKDFDQIPFRKDGSKVIETHDLMEYGDNIKAFIKNLLSSREQKIREHCDCCGLKDINLKVAK